ncbi:MAG: 4-hydroxybenzoate octaprenyltransferase [Oleiphilus sp.]
MIHKEKLRAYLQLARLDKPIGIYLVLWPTLWSLWLAAEGLPSTDVLIVFVLGVVLMRSAGCVINDFADRKIDGAVKRTKERPLIKGTISPKQALIFFALLCLAAFLLVLTMNTLTIYLSFGGVFLAALYPFMKRYTHLPQIFLGAAFAWAVPMAFAAQTDSLPSIVWLIYLATLVWTVAYDTMYAMVDRDDDLKIGVKSTAILFGQADRAIIAALQVLVVLTFCIIGQQAKLGEYYFLGVVAVSVLFVYQQHLIRHRDRDACFQAFLNNNWVGLILFCALVLDFFVR